MSAMSILTDIVNWFCGWPVLKGVCTAVPEITQHWFMFFALFGTLMLAMLGWVGKGLGLQNLFHDDRDMIDTHYRNVDAGTATCKWCVYWNSAALFSQFALVVFITLTWGFAYTLGPDHTQSGGPFPEIWKEAGPRILVFTAIGLAVGILAPRPAASIPHFEWLRSIIGAVIGLGFATFVFAMAQEIAMRLPETWVNRPTYGLVVAAGFINVIVLTWKRLLPCVALINLLAVLVVLYAAITTLPDASHLGTVVLLGFYVVLCNGLLRKFRGQDPLLKFEFAKIEKIAGVDPYPYKNRLKLGDIYQSRQEKRPPADNTIDPLEALEQWRQGQWPPRRPPRHAPAPPGDKAGAEKRHDPETFVDPIEALDNWRKNFATNPKLVLVATSGGAYRASFWTALVLDELTRRDQDNRLPDFARNIRLITGASGGMVAAAYFTALMNEESPHPPSVLKQLEDDISNAQSRKTAAKNGFPYPRSYPIPRDSLSPVAQQLVQGDFPHLFAPGLLRIDRGDILELQWLSLSCTFENLIAGERAGWRPSIVFSPMIVETGQPLLITNLDIDCMLADRRTESAVFFDWFPAARKTFQVRTAVRMNASFPYVSPATALPTIPYRRIVDAGYYDNYGVDLAVAYLAHPRIRDWVVKNTSGVAVIEIRAFPHAEPSDEETSPLLRGFQWLTTPVEGMLSARGSTMTFRNRQSFRRLQDTFDLALKLAGGGVTGSGEDFLRSFTFEVDTDTSLNWYLPKHELADMVTFLDRGSNPQSFADLEAFW